MTDAHHWRNQEKRFGYQRDRCAACGTLRTRTEAPGAKYPRIVYRTPDGGLHDRAPTCTGVPA